MANQKTPVDSGQNPIETRSALRSFIRRVLVLWVERRIMLDRQMKMEATNTPLYVVRANPV